MSEKYNGWSNYETWCINLWMDNEEGTYEHFQQLAINADDVYELSQQIKEYHEDAASTVLGDHAGVMADLLRGALSEVNWQEIAKHWIEAEATA